MADIAAMVDDLRLEQQSLDETVAALEPPDWGVLTPAPGWTVRHQIGHLAY
jgi:uncharacterized protein (TIGR03083 family)